RAERCREVDASRGARGSTPSRYRVGGSSPRRTDGDPHPGDPGLGPLAYGRRALPGPCRAVRTLRGTWSGIDRIAGGEPCGKSRGEHVAGATAKASPGTVPGPET